MQKEGKKTAENTIFYIILGILPFLAALICLGIGRYSDNAVFQIYKCKSG